jgi:hypothetical protein
MFTGGFLDKGFHEAAYQVHRFARINERLPAADQVYRRVGNELDKDQDLPVLPLQPDYTDGGSGCLSPHGAPISVGGGRSR